MKTSAVLSKLPIYKTEIDETIEQFRRNFFDDEKIWEEVVYCLCTPQTKAVNSLKAVEMLRERGLLTNPRFDMTAQTLKAAGVRFHKTKARYIVLAAEKFSNILETIRADESVTTIRDLLVNNFYGFGYKEASHLLRNVGFDNLAIIDRHIKKYMLTNRLVSKIFPTLTRRRYMVLEQKFIAHSRKLGVSPAMLDLLIWASATGRVLK